MADFRAANSAYQLDVDIMMIDYTVYWAVDAKLKALKIALETSSTASSTDLKSKPVPDSVEEKSSERLVSTFDTLMNLFHHHHPNATLSEGTVFNIKILEFLVLLGQYVHKEPQSQPQRDQMRQERLSSSRYRQMWLNAWCLSDYTEDSVLKRYFSRNQDNNDPSNSTYQSFLAEQTDAAYLELNDIQTRFLDLSAEVSESMGCVNERWYELSAEMMLQSAIDRTTALTDPKSSPSVSLNTEKLMVRWISECFAWGFLQPSPFEVEPDSSQSNDIDNEDALHEQTFICNTFRRPGDSSLDPSNDLKSEKPNDDDTLMTDAPTITTETHITPAEDPRWTKIRTQSHAAILSLLQTQKSGPSDKTADQAENFGNVQIDTRTLHQITEDHPRDAFLVDVRDFVDGLWCLNVDCLTGKPVLVQIEEGGIKGLSEAEFKTFLGNVGLRMGRKVDGDGKEKGFVRWAN